MKKYTIIIGLAIAAALLAGAILWLLLRKTKEISYTGPIEKISLGAELNMRTSAVWIAENQGYFKEQGLDVQIQGFASGRTALMAMLEEGNLNMVTVTQTPLMFTSFSRNDYAIIAGITHSYSSINILGRRDRGIETPADLKNKKVGVPKGTTAHFFLDIFLTQNGIPNSDIEVVDFAIDKLVQGLIEGKVDAISAWEPHIFNAREVLGQNATLLPNPGLLREDLYFVARNDFTSSHPDALKKFLKAIDKANAFIGENKETAISIVSERTKFDRRTVAAIWDAYTLRLFLDQNTLIILDEEAKWARAKGLIDGKVIPDYFDYLYLDALEAVKPEALQVIH
ncbi:MAG: NrtA/SsuA/CpmA family ABC transporter substrate-binding protein [Candidatus Nealsonbacteria bacterium]|nr:NrtA/SsuA/CpmA family ABC transporter substrate-binding protein [Candidatus Nealsonbacteria bacterium]